MAEKHDDEAERDGADPATDDVRHTVHAEDRARVLQRPVDEFERPGELNEARQRVALVGFAPAYIVAKCEGRSCREPVEPSEAPEWTDDTSDPL